MVQSISNYGRRTASTNPNMLAAKVKGATWRAADTLSFYLVESTQQRCGSQ